MQKIRFLMYKAKLGDGHVIDNAIDLVTLIGNPQVWRKPYLRCSHTEVWEAYKGCFTVEEFQRRNGYIEDWMQGKTYIGLCLTSTMGATGGKNRTGSGVTLRPAWQILDKHPDRWFYFEAEAEDCNIYDAHCIATHLWARNKGYGIIEITSFFLPFRIDTDKWICSEFVALYAKNCGLDVPNEAVCSPVRLALAMNQYATPRNLIETRELKAAA